MDWRNFSTQPIPWQGNSVVTLTDFPFIVMTRSREYRNFSGFPFSVSATPQSCADIADKALVHFSKIGDYSISRLIDGGPSVVRLLRERHYLPERSTAFPGKAGSKYLLVDSDSKSWALVNEVEHVTVIHVNPGLIESQAIIPSSVLDNQFLWSWSQKFGYLTSNPEHVGILPQMEIVLHLPALVLSRKLFQARNMLTALGIGFSPIYTQSENSVESALFVIRSRGGAGKFKDAGVSAHKDFLEKVSILFNWEKNLQLRCLETSGDKLEARIKASLQYLKQVGSLSFTELLRHSSYLRLGAYLKIVPSELIEMVETLRVVTGTGHLAVSAGSILSKEEEDISRANVVRLTLEAGII